MINPLSMAILATGWLFVVFFILYDHNLRRNGSAYGEVDDEWAPEADDED